MLRKWGVLWGPSSPHHPQSNGHAEAAVATIKSLALKTVSANDLRNDEFLMGLLEYRNTPRATSLSPAEIVFGHQLRSIVPVHRENFAER